MTKPFFGGACAARFALALLVLGTTCLSYAQGTVTYAGLGGPLQEAVMKGLFADAGKLGINVREERNGGWAGVKAHFAADAPGWDLVSIGFARCEQIAKTGKLTPIDYSIVDKSMIAPHLALPNYVGVYTFAYSIAYQKKKYGANPPQGWADFFDAKKFPGRRTLQAEGLYSLEAALIADGVPARDVYKVLRDPKGVDRALKKIAELKPHVAVWFRSGGQLMQLMRDGEVDMALFPNGRAAALIKDGSDIGFVWNGGFIDVECMMVPKNAPNPRDAMRLIRSALEPKNQAALANMIQYGPVNPKAYEIGAITKENLGWLPTSPDNLPKQVYADQSWYASPEAEQALIRYSKLLQ